MKKIIFIFGLSLLFNNNVYSANNEILLEKKAENISISEIGFAKRMTQTARKLGMVNTTFIENFKKSFYLINTARGQSVITKDLVVALKAKKISGACLDVLDMETSSFEKVTEGNDTAFEELVNLDNVILSPHIAGWTHESKFKMAQFIVDKIKMEFDSLINNE